MANPKNDDARHIIENETSGGWYEQLSRNQLVRLLEKRDRERKLGLVWERDELESDQTLEGELIAATPAIELGDGAAPWRNLVIEGDNYNALRWLRMTYAGRVESIYVDPPYNTEDKHWSTTIYFSSDDRYRHSTWLEFLYRRFRWHVTSLTEDGVLLPHHKQTKI